MRSLQWNPEQAVHVPEIDAEHQEMFRLAGELREALLAGEKMSRAGLLSRRLAAEINAHLSHEERLLRDAAYSAYGWHERQHRTGRSRLAALERETLAGARDAGFEALESLAAWMRDHTTVADRMAGSYLRNYWRTRVREETLVE